jgi:hypothetical protein
VAIYSSGNLFISVSQIAYNTPKNGSLFSASYLKLGILKRGLSWEQIFKMQKSNPNFS